MRHWVHSPPKSKVLNLWQKQNQTNRKSLHCRGVEFAFILFEFVAQSVFTPSSQTSVRWLLQGYISLKGKHTKNSNSDFPLQLSLITSRTLFPKTPDGKHPVTDWTTPWRLIIKGKWSCLGRLLIRPRAFISRLLSSFPHHCTVMV